jgi:hypothetical protein
VTASSSGTSSDVARGSVKRMDGGTFKVPNGVAECNISSSTPRSGRLTMAFLKIQQQLRCDSMAVDGDSSLIQIRSFKRCEYKVSPADLDPLVLGLCYLGNFCSEFDCFGFRIGNFHRATVLGFNSSSFFFLLSLEPIKRNLILDLGCRYPVDQVPQHISFKTRQGAGRAPMRHHVSYSTGSCLSAKVGSKVVTCPGTPYPASLIRRDPMPPHVLWLRTHWEGSGAPCVLWLKILPPCWEGSGLPRIL